MTSPCSPCETIKELLDLRQKEKETYLKFASLIKTKQRSINEA